MKEIELTKGYKALVDDRDYEWLSGWKWSANDDGKGNIRAMRMESAGDGKQRTVKYSCGIPHLKEGGDG